MATSSNVISAEYYLEVQRNANFELYLKAKDADGNYINWNLVTPKVQVKNVIGVVVAEFVIGDGLTVDPDDNTILYLRKAADEKNMPPGTYRWDLKVEFSEEQAQYPLRGNYISVDYITE